MPVTTGRRVRSNNPRIVVTTNFLFSVTRKQKPPPLSACSLNISYTFSNFHSETFRGESALNSSIDGPTPRKKVARVSAISRIIFFFFLTNFLVRFNHFPPFSDRRREGTDFHPETVKFHRVAPVNQPFRRFWTLGKVRRIKGTRKGETSSRDCEVFVYETAENKLR